jgi:hypothetical protein
MAKGPGAPKNWAQARNRIDRGETGDKIAVDDPAAAPLGTDAEAGGASTRPADIARSARLQDHGAAARAAARAPRTADRRQLVPWLVAIVVFAVAVLAAVLVAG